MTNKLGKAQKQSSGSAKAAEEVFRQLMKVSRRAQLVAEEARLLRLRVSKVAKARDDAIGAVEKQSQKVRA